MTTNYRITAAVIDDFKRLRHVEIRPDADSAVILIGGKNANGKSSILDALTAALGGKRALPADPVRHGAEEAKILVEFNGGALTVNRTVTKDGASTLEVRDRDGRVTAAQGLLDRLVGARFLDPIAFLLLPAKEQRATLLKLIDKDNRIETLEQKREKAYTDRTDAGRDLIKAKGELGRLEVLEVLAPIEVAALAAERAAFAELQRAGDGLGSAHKQAQREAIDASARVDEGATLIAELEQRLAMAKTKQAALVADLAACQQLEKDALAKLNATVAKWQATAERRAELDADLARADEHNRGVFAAEASNKRRAEAADLVARLEVDREVKTALLDKIDRRKIDILAEAKLPVENLSVDKDGITLNGVPFAQASGAEKLRVALGLAMSASPNLDDIWIRDGSLLDEDSMEYVVASAQAAGKRLWIEIVGTSNPGAIVIQDGCVRDVEQRAAG